MTIDWQVHTFADLSSTQDYARQWAEEGQPEGVVIQALSQNQGRGRQGNVWQSPMGNLYMSVVLRPGCTADKAGQMSFVTAVALSAAMDHYIEPGHDKRVKWPNDILIDGRKAAGILIESMLGQGGVVDALIVGIGVNILAPPESAIGLASLSGSRPVPIHPFRDAVLKELDETYHQWKHQGFGPIRTRWMKQAHKEGDSLSIRAGDQRFEGLYKGIDESGALLVSADGQLKTITAAEIIG